ncbi:uncharacterized protein LOC125491871 [Beta vulgaris subsp. vulgaris]|uniref:uncharacterized protein LOC125491871 n=1 Tax=Beta vulgaris subsp. vulgaris TaxID=3555 RepID=UPI00203718DB|nr:uncharacterized protein LOC125491871 [Beta vulgaris subsp. vulgaris]
MRAIDARMNELETRVELFWRQRSRQDWLKNGDKNTNGQVEVQPVIDKVQRKVTDEMGEMLRTSFTGEEVYEALSQMHPTKAPGPNGMCALFYQKAWHIIGRDVIDTALEILNNDALANRLKKALPDVIHESQGGFVPGRLITDNILVAYECFHYLRKKRKGKTGYLRLKLDMSKGYDRVESEFLEAMMVKLGFLRSFVDVTMKCVKSASFSILLNEGLSTLLRVAEKKKEIHGVKIGKKVDPISHLFFADDSLLFIKANCEEVEKILDIFSNYEAGSGQKLNMEKSEVSFSRNIEPEKKELLQMKLNFKAVDEHDKYLGLPTYIGSSKKRVFQSIQERILKKLKGWKEGFVSQVGREILIKTVAPAIPTYSMQCFAIPVGILKEMERAWRVMTNTSSLMTKTLKNKYFPNTTFLEAKASPVASYTWRSILIARKLVQQNAIKVVGGGHSISVWRDPWIRGLPHFKPLPRSGCTEELPQKVSDLMNNGRWDSSTLQEAKKDDHATNSDNQVLSIWGKVWKAKVAPKVLNFGWKVLHDSIPVKEKWYGDNCVMRKITIRKVIDKAVSFVGEWEKANEVMVHEGPRMPQLVKVWKPPDEGCYKINSNAALFGENLVGFGGVVRDYLGDIMIATCASMEGEFQVEEVEAMAARHSLQIATQAGLRTVELETDNVKLFSHSKKSFGGNTVAHILARESNNYSEMRVWMEEVPSVAHNAVILDSLLKE